MWPTVVETVGSVRHKNIILVNIYLHPPCYVIVQVVSVPGVPPAWSARMPTVSTPLPAAVPSSAASCPASPPGGSGTRPGPDTTLRCEALTNLTSN